MKTFPLTAATVTGRGGVGENAAVRRSVGNAVEDAAITGNAVTAVGEAASGSPVQPEMTKTSASALAELTIFISREW